MKKYHLLNAIIISMLFLLNNLAYCQSISAYLCQYNGISYSQYPYYWGSTKICFCVTNTPGRGTIRVAVEVAENGLWVPKPGYIIYDPKVTNPCGEIWVDFGGPGTYQWRLIAIEESPMNILYGEPQTTTLYPMFQNVTISGTSPLTVGQQGTWTATVTGGRPPLDIQWYIYYVDNYGERWLDGITDNDFCETTTFTRSSSFTKKIRCRVTDYYGIYGIILYSNEIPFD